MRSRLLTVLCALAVAGFVFAALSRQEPPQGPDVDPTAAAGTVDSVVTGYLNAYHNPDLSDEEWRAQVDSAATDRLAALHGTVPRSQIPDAEVTKTTTRVTGSTATTSAWLTGRLRLTVTSVLIDQEWLVDTVTPTQPGLPA